MNPNIAYISQLSERMVRGLCMLGNIYTRQRCPVCNGKMVHDERRKGCFCERHQNISASSGFFVKFPASPPIFRRFDRDYDGAARFLTGLRFKRDEGSLDPRDYRADNPLGFANQVDVWLSIKRKQNLKKTTISNLEREMGRAIDWWQNRNVKTIGTAEIEDFLFADHVSAKNGEIIKSKTRAQLRSTIHQFFSWVCRREKTIEMPEIPNISFELGWRNIVDISTQQAIIDEIKKISFDLNPRIWLGVHILSHNNNVRPGELVQILEQDIFIEHRLVQIKKAKEGSLKPGKYAELWPEEIAVIEALPPAIPRLPFFRHMPGMPGVVAGTPFSTKYFNIWWQRACKNIGVEGVSLYPGTKHSTMTALSKLLSPEQIRRGGSKHTSKAIERYILPDRQETELVQKTIKQMHSAYVIDFQGATIVQPKNGAFKKGK